ncbi:MAG: ABC transporter permease [Clostridium sp.]
MNFIFRAFKSLKERIGRTIIIFAVMLTVCIVTLSSFSIKSATETAAILARQKLGAQVSLTVDREKVMKTQQLETQNSGGEPGRFKITSNPIPLEYLEELKTSSYITEYSLTSSTGVNLDGLTAVGVEETTTTTSDKTNSMIGNMPGGNKSPMGNQGDVTLYGINSFESDSSVISGDNTLVDGRELEAEDLGSNVVMLEETFASENSLVVGSKLNLVNTSDETSIIEVEVVGIYKSTTEVDEMAQRMTAMLPYNKIYAPYTLVGSFKGEEYASAVDNMIFYINDPANVEAFVEEGQNTSIDFNTFKLDANDQAYEAMIGPVENVASFSNTTLILVTLFGGVILALIIMLSIKDRTNEIGILMSLGEKRSKIISQLIVEVILVLTLSIGVSAVLGNTISDVVGNKLVQNEISTQEEESTGMPGMNQGQNREPGKFNQSNMAATNVEVIDELDISMSGSDFGKMATISFVLAIIATLIPSIAIMRLNPKTILSKHN